MPERRRRLQAQPMSAMAGTACAARTMRRQRGHQARPRASPGRGFPAGRSGFGLMVVGFQSSDCSIGPAPSSALREIAHVGHAVLHVLACHSGLLREAFLRNHRPHSRCVARWPHAGHRQQAPSTRTRAIGETPGPPGRLPQQLAEPYLARRGPGRAGSRLIMALQVRSSGVERARPCGSRCQGRSCCTCGLKPASACGACSSSRP